MIATAADRPHGAARTAPATDASHSRERGPKRRPKTTDRVTGARGAGKLAASPAVLQREGFGVELWGVSVRPASLRHLPVVYAGFMLSFSTYSTMKETDQLRPALTQYLSGRAERDRLLVARGGLSFAAVEPQPGDGWYLAWLSAWPHRRGHGSVVLAELRRRSDEVHASLSLHCPAVLVPWYRRYGFLPAQPTRSERDTVARRQDLTKLRRPGRSRQHR